MLVQGIVPRTGWVNEKYHRDTLLSIGVHGLQSGICTKHGKSKFTWPCTHRQEHLGCVRACEQLEASPRQKSQMHLVEYVFAFRGQHACFKGLLCHTGTNAESGASG
jgi:hypothetical protein